MSRMLFVSRDNGGAKMSVPTALLALERGHEVGLVIEGLAADRFQDAGLLNAGSKAKLLFRGTEDHRDTPFFVGATSLLRKFAPDVVVATRSYPDSLEGTFGIAVNRMGKIPLVLMEDFWAGYRSCPVRPDVLVTLDDYAAGLAKDSHPMAKIVIAGNPTVISINESEIPPDVVARVDGLRAKFGRVFIFAGGNPEQMTEELQLLVKCLKLTKDWCLISRPHPTIAKSEKEPGLKWNDFWNGILSELGERVVSVDCKVGDHLAMLCDATISGFSLMLNTAAYARKAAISLQTEICSRELLTSVGLSKVPVVALGCASELSTPCDLGPLVQAASEDNLSKLKPFDPKIALEAIESCK